MHLSDSVTVLRGIGSARAEKLAALGITTVYDLLRHFPRSYEDRTQLLPICEMTIGEPACFRAMVVTNPRTAHIRKGLDLTKLTVADDTARLRVVFFNQKFTAERLQYGAEYRFYGTIEGDDTGYQISNPTVEPESAAGTLTGRIVPVYPLTAGLSGRALAQMIGEALDGCLPLLPELLPASVRREYGLIGVREAYRAIHAPSSFDELSAARRYLAFEEFFVFSAGLSVLRARRTGAAGLPFSGCDLADFYAALPFSLTGAQRRAISDIVRDLQSNKPMNRLVQGDVGSGKTMIAAAAVCCAAKSGYQAALMAPTEILAEQHAATLAPLLRKLGIETVLLTGSLGAPAKRNARAALQDGRAQLAVGTQALLSESTQFQALGLVIADEQHRFGVAQRAALSDKGARPHLLVMSATPIPRTLALMLYGDLDLSLVDELPPGRQTVDTFLVSESYRARLDAFIRKQAEEGHQVFVVCPAVEESEDESLKSAEGWSRELAARLPELRIALLHGQMKGAEKDRVMRAFAAHEADVLVTTTVIEVGVDVPNATLMIVENAERFGLSQLHQLRGRVGRGPAKSYCVLVSDTKNDQTRQRLTALCKTNDGFRIAEEDLALRGPGDFFGTQQHGLPAFAMASLQTDMQTLHQAQEACERYLDPAALARNPEYRPLRERIRRLFDERSSALN